jgi:uncharacterized protein
MGMKKRCRQSKEARRHRFASGALVFDDPHVVFRKDRIVDGEQRWHSIGAAQSAIAGCPRISKENENGEEIIRIISAREANQRECRIYIHQAGE